MKDFPEIKKLPPRCAEGYNPESLTEELENILEPQSDENPYRPHGYGWKKYEFKFGKRDEE